MFAAASVIVGGRPCGTANICLSRAAAGARKTRGGGSVNIFGRAEASENDDRAKARGIFSKTKKRKCTYLRSGIQTFSSHDGYSPFRVFAMFSDDSPES